MDCRMCRVSYYRGMQHFTVFLFLFGLNGMQNIICVSLLCIYYIGSITFFMIMKAYSMIKFWLSLMHDNFHTRSYLEPSISHR